jgi:hypothetical protein
LLALSVLPGVARADFSITPTNTPQPNEENVLLNNGTTGASVAGLTNKTGTPIVFTSMSQLLNEPSSGQARIQAVNAEGTQFPLLGLSSISAVDATLKDMIFNEFIGGGVGAPGGPTTITVNGVDAAGIPVPSLTETFTLGNGSNFFTIVATNGQQITSVSFDSPDGIADLRQVRVSGIRIIPEPSSMTLVALGLGLVGLHRRRKAPATA